METDDVHKPRETYPIFVDASVFPVGSISSQKTQIFDPKTDITTFELAKAMCWLLARTQTGGYLHIDLPDDPNVRRHFREE